MDAAGQIEVDQTIGDVDIEHAVVREKQRHGYVQALDAWTKSLALTHAFQFVWSMTVDGILAQQHLPLA